MSMQFKFNVQAMIKQEGKASQADDSKKRHTELVG